MHWIHLRLTCAYGIHIGVKCIGLVIAQYVTIHEILEILTYQRYPDYISAKFSFL